MFIKKKMWLGKVRGKAPRSKLPLPSLAGGAATPAMHVLPANRCSIPVWTMAARGPNTLRLALQLDRTRRTPLVQPSH